MEHVTLDLGVEFKSHFGPRVCFLKNYRAAWVAQWIKHRTLDLGSGHDLGIMRLSPASGFALGMELAWDSLCPSVSHIFPSPQLLVLVEELY